MEGSDGTDMIFNAGEIIALEWMHETVSALCCAATFVVSTPDRWDAFRDWLADTVSKGQDDREFLEANATRRDMVAALMKADRLLMLVEGAQALSDTEIHPPWMDEKQ